MKKLILIMSLIAITLSSCLKDKTYLDFPNAGNIVNFPLSGLANFSADAVLADTAVIKFAVDYATSSPNKALTVTLAVDTTIVAKYNAANPGGTQYLVLPASAYSFTGTKVSIAAGAQYAFTTININKYLLDPTKSYMLPVKIADASGVAISANQSIHYFHVIGNDFAGSYSHTFTRTPAGGNFTGQAATFLPDSPTQIEVAGGYYTGTVRYVVSYTETGAGASATYSNFTISINADDVTNILNANGISVTSAPKIIGYDSSQTYTYAQALVLFQNGFTYSVLGGSGSRVNLDQYTHL
jgi:hypothetical protein